MEVLSKLGRLLRDISFYGLILAVILGGITIYAVFFQEKRPTLKLKLLSSASVLDVREKIEKLEIFYNGIDIQNKNQALRVILLKVINDGGGTGDVREILTFEQGTFQPSVTQNSLTS